MTELAKRRRAILGALGSEEINISDQLSWVKGNPGWLGLIENSSSTTGRLLSSGTRNIVRIVSTDSEITYAVVFTNTNGRAEKILTTNNEIVTQTNFNGQQALLYHTGATDVPLLPQTAEDLSVRIMARRGTGGNITVDDHQYLEVWQR